MVTHNLGQARRLGDEILFLHQGQLVERARAGPVLQDPQSSRSRDVSCEGELPW